ncbi:hypothetical protein AJ80_09132 [Polytolypa hystricis UAMH7299]|uniref:Magnesium and cobalt transporter CorA n=1 Tax=Polytolypa hystricis (strain UAMH7299) TaxID=1447883 RepID=A0A2B7WVW0_POLH7|nr:hypothetical protein AJ80_09132 [Polytolypa hystricis UAMH7299]
MAAGVAGQSEIRDEEWRNHGVNRGVNGPRFSYLHDWIESHGNVPFELTVADFEWKHANSREWAITNKKTIYVDGPLDELSSLLRPQFSFLFQNAPLAITPKALRNSMCCSSDMKGIRRLTTPSETGFWSVLSAQKSFSQPSLRLSRELHDMTNTFLQYIWETPLISNDNGTYFQRVITPSEGQIRDLHDLRDRSVNLIGMIFNTISIQEANNGIRQGQSLKYLSILATVFAPLPLFSSIFGMNVQELGIQHGPKMRSFVAIAIPSSMALVLVAWFLRPLFGYLGRTPSWSNPRQDHHPRQKEGLATIRSIILRRDHVNPLDVTGLDDRLYLTQNASPYPL